MIRIGLLTYCNVPNFGANLQGLSTLSYLKNHNIEAYLINWSPYNYKEGFTNKFQKGQYLEHHNFVNKYIRLTEECHTEDELVSVINNYGFDAIIIGSDAVLKYFPLWSRIIFPCKKIITIEKVNKDTEFPNPFWGTFKNRLKRKLPIFMMSVSSQDCEYYFIGKEIRLQMEESLNKISWITVRDDWAQKMISSITNNKIQAPITPDPVFAFNDNVHDLIPSKEYIQNKYNLPENYYLISFRTKYIVSSKWIIKFQKEAKKEGVSCVSLPMPNKYLFDKDLEYNISMPLSPLDWYALIKYSKGYIGENMHPIIVALHNQVPVYSFDTYGIRLFMRLLCYEKSSKIYHLLKLFKLEHSNRVNANKIFFKRPSVREVLDAISNYPKTEVKKICSELHSSYEVMMNKIMQGIKETNLDI